MILITQVHNPSSSEVKRESETTTEVATQKTVESEVQKIAEAREYTRSTSNKANDAHNVGEMKKIETYTTARNPRAQKSTKSETVTVSGTLEI